MLRKLTAFAALCSLFPLAGCATNTAVIDGSCQVFRPISNSSKDTLQTRKEVIAHNKVFKTVCG